MAGERVGSDKPSTGRLGSDKVQLSIYVSRDIADAARNAVIATTAYNRGYVSLSELVAEAIAEKIAKLEKQFNNGRPFPARVRSCIPAVHFVSKPRQLIVAPLVAPLGRLCDAGILIDFNAHGE